MGVGKEISVSAVLDGSWVNDVESPTGFQENFGKIDGLFKSDDTKECCNIIGEIL